MKNVLGRSHVKKGISGYVAILVGVILSTVSSGVAVESGNRNYTYLYFEYGLPLPKQHRRPGSEANAVALAHPDLVVETGYYSLRLGCDDMELSGFDALSGSDYLTALTNDVSVFTPANLTLSVTKDGTVYTCTSATVQNSTNQFVRLIESSRFVQRFDHLGLIFKDGSGNVLDADGRLEVTAWSDRATFKLDLSGASGVTETSVQIVSPASVTHASVSANEVAILTVQPHLDTQLSDLNVASYITEATDLSDGSALTTYFDQAEAALYVDLPIDNVSYPSAGDRFDEFLIEVTNPNATAQNIPLVFEEINVRVITGTIMTMCEEADGRPIGIPVQISKNWHGTSSDIVHRGSWLRGYTMLNLAAGETKRFRLRVVFGYWGGAGAISHSQLSLIGWGKNWKWDESALGAWGESCTYDPCLHAGASFMDDIRPSFTMGYTSETDHSWTENSGGGDFLIYRDSNDTYRWVKRLKTAYHWVGPNMTEVLYSGVTDDDKIRVTYSSRAGSSLDYHRRFHGYKYEFLQDVVSPKRFVFHQMAADYYPGPVYTNYYVGDASGLLSEGVVDLGGNTYKDAAFQFNNQWLAFDDVTTYGTYTASRRGLISLSSTLNGNTLPVYMHRYGRSWGSPDRMLFDLSSSSVENSYAAGDVIEGELEFIMPPKSTSDYWGGDAEFINRLSSYGNNAWQAVYDEYRYNLELNVTAHVGTLERNYPVEVRADTDSHVAADVTFNGGGIGHVPLVVRGVPPDKQLVLQRYVAGDWVYLESVNISDHDYYQGYLNADGTMDYAFSIQRLSLDLDEAWRVRVLTEIPAGAYWALDDVAGTVALDHSDNGFEGTVVDAEWVSGVNGGALDFNGSSSMVSLPAAAFAAIGNEITIAMWVYGDTTQPQSDSVFYAKDGGGSRVLNIHLPYGNSIIYWDAGNSTGYDRISKVANPSDFKGAWNHWVFTKNATAGEMKIYHNGELWHSGTGHTRTVTGITAAALGNQLGGLHYDGMMDDVRLYAVVLDAAEVAGLYESSQNANNYSAWTWSFGLTGSDANWDANTDGDELNNLGEYALGGDPTNGNYIGYRPTISKYAGVDTNGVEYVYARRLGTENELSYYLEMTDGLVEPVWGNGSYLELPTEGTLPGDENFEAVTNLVDTTGKTNEFIRLMIEEL